MNESNATLTAQQQLSQIIEAQGFDHFGFVKMTKPTSFEFYRAWLDQGMHGSMSYLERHAPIKENPDLLFKNVKTAITVGCNYIPHPQPLDIAHTHSLRIAAYARGKDYHEWLKDRLDKLVIKFKEHSPAESFLAFTDSSPVLERDWAHQAGLGWFGKNTCLIHQQKGSFFLIGEILTTLDVPVVSAIHPDRCGTCTRCIEACPTQALVSPRKLDAKRCISYLTIESKDVPAENLREAIGDNFFGCDICQAVCPWNEKIFGEAARSEQPVLKNSTDQLSKDLRFILTRSTRDLERHFADTPLSRAKGFGLKRNALIVVANHRLKDLKAEVELLTTDPRLGELAQWVLARLQIEI